MAAGLGDGLLEVDGVAVNVRLEGTLAELVERPLVRKSGSWEIHDPRHPRPGVDLAVLMELGRACDRELTG